MQLILVSVDMLFKTPRNPPGPSYKAENVATNNEVGMHKKPDSNPEKRYLLMVLQDEDIEKQNEALYLVQKLTKP